MSVITLLTIVVCPANMSVAWMDIYEIPLLAAHRFHRIQEQALAFNVNNKTLLFIILAVPSGVAWLLSANVS